MLDVLHFIFSSIWVFLGTVVLLSILAKVILGIVAICRNGQGNITIE